MTDVVPIHAKRSRAGGGSERLAALRERLGSEIHDLSRRQTDRIADLSDAGAGPEGVGNDGQAVGRRIRLLGQLIAGLATADPATLWDDRAGHGSTVFVRDLDRGEEAFYTLVNGDLIDVDANQVSLASPLGRALLGCRVGDEPGVETPRGTRRLRVLAVETLPRSAGIGEPPAPGAA